jgi:hypothetical protein
MFVYVYMNQSTPLHIIEIPVSNNRISLDNPNVKKMVFIMNALEQGWTVKKRGDAFVFRKKHEGRKEVLRKDYLDNFIEHNFDSSHLFQN